MTTSDKSQWLWIGGGLLGGVVGYLTTKSGGKAVAGAALGSIIVGAIGDKVIEQHGRTGEWSLLPLGRTGGSSTPRTVVTGAGRAGRILHV